MRKTQVNKAVSGRLSVGGGLDEKRGGRSARLDDAYIVTIGDPAAAAHLLSRTRIDLFRAIKTEPEPATINRLAARLQRDRSGVSRDVDALACAGLVSVETALNPGHGTLKLVRAVASRIDVRVMID